MVLDHILDHFLMFSRYIFQVVFTGPHSDVFLDSLATVTECRSTKFVL